MKKILLLTFFTLFLISCGSTKHAGTVSESIVTNNNKKAKTVRKLDTKKNKRVVKEAIEEEISIDNPEEILTNLRREVIDYAKTFEGTRYKFGGTTEAGMDCSGLVNVAFQKENIQLPRISRDIATKGISVAMKDIEEGDLVFFKTSRKYDINHVGIVVEKKRGEIKFIHSSTSAGVIISSLDEEYWKNAFVTVRRII